MSQSKGKLRDRMTRRQLELRQLRIEHRAALRRTTPREGAKFRGFIDVLNMVLGVRAKKLPPPSSSPLQPFTPIAAPQRFAPARLARTVGID